MIYILFVTRRSIVVLRTFRLLATLVVSLSLLTLTYSVLAANGGDTAETAPLFTETFADSDDTTGAADDYHLGAIGSCNGNTVFFLTGQGPDLVYRLNIPKTCQANLKLTPTYNANLALYVVSDPANLTTCIDFSDDGTNWQPETIAFTATENLDYYIIVDGGGILNNAGSYDLDVTCGTDPTPIDIATSITASSDPILAGQPLTYNLVVTNTATSAGATGIKVTSQLPTGTTPDSNSCGAAIVDNVLTWTIGDLASENTISCQITVNVPITATGELINRVIVSGNQADPTPENNSAVASTAIIPVATDLSLSKTTLTAVAAPGTLVTYTLSFSNIGGTPAADLTITDWLPNILTNVSTAVGNVAITPVSDSPYTWNVPNLAFGTAGVITIQGQIVTPLTDQVITNSATITAAAPDIDPSNNSDAVSIDVRNPILVYSISPNDNKLRVINLVDGTTIDEISINLPSKTVQDGYGLARHPMTGELWALLKIQDTADHILATIDHTTGVATYIGNTGDAFAGLTFNQAGTLYAISDDSADVPETLFTLNATDATPTSILTVSNVDEGEAIAHNPDNDLIYHASGSDADGSEILEAVNVTNKAVTNIPLSGADYDEATALFYEGQGQFIVADIVQRLYRVTTEGLVTSLSRSLDHRARGFAPTNLAGFKSEPEPDSILNVGTTIIGTTILTTLTVLESGDAQLDVSIPSDGLIIGPHADDFHLSQGSPPFSISDGSPAKNITIQCTPKDVGLRTATVRFALNNSAYPTVSYQLECTGALAAKLNNINYLPVLLK